MRIQQDESSSFVSITQDEDDDIGSYWVKVDAVLAIAGEYTTEFIVQDLDGNGEPLEQTIEIKMIIIDSELKIEDEADVSSSEKTAVNNDDSSVTSFS